MYDLAWSSPMVITSGKNPKAWTSLTTSIAKTINSCYLLASGNNWSTRICRRSIAAQLWRVRLAIRSIKSMDVCRCSPIRQQGCIGLFIHRVSMVATPSYNPAPVNFFRCIRYTPKWIMSVSNILPVWIQPRFTDKNHFFKGTKHSGKFWAKAHNIGINEDRIILPSVVVEFLPMKRAIQERKKKNIFISSFRIDSRLEFI